MEPNSSGRRQQVFVLIHAAAAPHAGHCDVQLNTENPDVGHCASKYNFCVIYRENSEKSATQGKSSIITSYASDASPPMLCCV